MAEPEDALNKKTAASAMRELEKVQRLLRKIRTDRGWSIRYAARKLGMSRNDVFTLETSGNSISFERLQTYALLMGYRMKVTVIELNGKRREVDLSPIDPAPESSPPESSPPPESPPPELPPLGLHESPFDAEGNLK